MFSSSRSKNSTDSFSKSRAGKSSSSKVKKSFKDRTSFIRKPADLDLSCSTINSHGPPQSTLKSPVLTISIGSTPRLFAAHQDILTSSSPFFQSALHSHFYTPSSSPSSPSSATLHLPDESPEVFSSVLEFLYRGDYSPRLIHDPRTGRYSLPSDASTDNTVWIASSSSSDCGATILKDTAVYCAAERYSLPALKRLALRKQGLQAGVPVGVVLSSARYAYANTPETDSKLRAHYLHLIIRSRDTFKRSGTMQRDMAGVGEGGALWFDLFCAMSNVLDDMEKLAGKGRK